ncbi:DUF2487 family protein [Paenibacillus lentus]|uniref:DUF2487 family protein n=1 Tax=Paenibacillus lentus TaxID=1338368 RepID=A0A3Q8SBX3_9BACL|nr:DUF2487 family protein [Paenibacillus lentus]AZK47192.1 DUF2487 family protein [Paenibacillus lentus]
MKFSDIEASSWEELRPYLDTCLIPVTGLTGSEQPYEVTAALERLRDVMDWIELPFKGRVVTYPSFQYGRDIVLSQINEICHNVKLSGFAYIIVVSADVELPADRITNADLIVDTSWIKGFERHEVGAALGREIQQMWIEN